MSLRRYTTPAIVFLSIIGVALILTTTRWGIGASPDSVAYLAGAQNMATGHGFSLFSGGTQTYEPITHFPPFYPALLSLSAFIGIDPILSVRWINALLFGCTLVLVGLIVKMSMNQESDSSFWIPVAATFIVLISVTSLQVFLMAWSEGLFILLGILGFWALGRYLDREQTPFLITTGVLLGASIITRYAGAAYLLSGLFGVFIFSKRFWVRRFVDGVTLGLLGTLPFLLWTFRNLSVGGTTTSRVLRFHPITWAKLSEGLTTVASWFFMADTLPSILKIGFLTLLGGLIAGGFFSGIRAEFNKNQTTLLETLQSIPGVIKFLATFLVVYSLFLIFSISFFDANTPLDARILSPAFVVLVILGLYGIGVYILNASGSRSIRVILAIFIFCGLSILPLKNLISTAYAQGLGFNHASWRESETISLVNQLAEGTAIFSNAPEAIYLHTGRGASRIPRPYEQVNQRANPDYEEQLAAMQTILSEEAGVLVYFNRIGRNTQPSKEDLVAALGVGVSTQAADGEIYTWVERD